jgi:tetratricopeptide (TPR) repeat protein
MKFPRRVLDLLCLSLCLGASLPLPAQGPQADASLPLFTVIAAAVAADDKGEVYTSPLAQQLRKDLAAESGGAVGPDGAGGSKGEPGPDGGKEIPSVSEIRRFLALNKADYTKLVSFALVIEGPPDFGFLYREVDLPSDAQTLIGLNPMLAEFYRDTKLDALWKKYKPIYEQQEAVYNESIAQVMLMVNGYLRTPSYGFYGRAFTPYIEMLGPPNQVNARSFENNYYEVITSSSQLQTDEVRHGYLHYLLEPMAAKESLVVTSKNKLLDTAKQAPALDRGLRRSFALFMTESLIRAVEMRMAKLSTAEQARRAQEAAVEGYFLVPYFLEALLKFEQQDAGMRLYYPEMIEKIDVGREEKRASQLTFSATAAPRSLHEFSADLRPGGDAVEALLADGEDALARHDVSTARKAYQAALEKASDASADRSANGSGRARALYGLALAATEAKQAEVAKTFFQETLDVAREPQLLAWSHIYLGRLLDMENRRDSAIKQYKQALESGEIAPGARQAAQKGLETPFTKPQ